jgi:hypothetical protein
VQGPNCSGGTLSFSLVEIESGEQGIGLNNTFVFYCVLSHNMRDLDIRSLLKTTTLSGFQLDGSSRIIDELRLPAASARIDVAVINGHFHGFEIKSAVDTLQRLPGQLEAYAKVFDYLYVVTESKHRNKVAAAVPGWVGIYVCCEDEGRVHLNEIQPATKNTAKDGFYIAKLLWREELISLLDTQHIAYRKKDRNWILCQILSSSLDVETLSQLVREKLKARPADWKTEVKADCEEG